MPDFVKLVNKSNQPFDFHQKNVKRIVEPGGDAIVPWDMACTLFGNPAVRNIAPANERTKMYEKLRARHNFSVGLQTAETWEEIRPRCMVYDLETDSEIVMLLDDPLGQHAPDAARRQQSTNQNSDVTGMQRQIDALTKQITRLVSQSTAVPAESASGSTASPTAVADGPGAPVDPGFPGADGNIDDVFALPTDDELETATLDDPQQVPVGEMDASDTEDTPPAVSAEPKKRRGAARLAPK
jgi:hypothetical protein